MFEKLNGGRTIALHLVFQKTDVLVSRGAADVADPRQFGHAQLPSLVGGVMPKEARRNIIGGHLRSADLLALCLCVLHARADSRPNHGQFQLAEHTCHLQKILAAVLRLPHFGL